MNKISIGIILIFQIILLTNLSGQEEYDDDLHVLILNEKKLTHYIYEDFDSDSRSDVAQQFFQTLIENYPMLELGISTDMVIMNTYVHLTSIRSKTGIEIYVYTPNGISIFGKKHPEIFYDKKLVKTKPIIKKNKN